MDTPEPELEIESIRTKKCESDDKKSESAKKPQLAKTKSVSKDKDDDSKIAMRRKLFAIRYFFLLKHFEIIEIYFDSRVLNEIGFALSRDPFLSLYL